MMCALYLRKLRPRMEERALGWLHACVCLVVAKHPLIKREVACAHTTLRIFCVLYFVVYSHIHSHCYLRDTVCHPPWVPRLLYGPLTIGRWRHASSVRQLRAHVCVGVMG